MKNSDVAKAWYYGLALKGNNLRSDGKALFSYGLKIGEINEKGDRICFDHRITGCSKSTSRHISLCSKVANKTVDPNGEATPQSFFQTTIFV